MDQLMHHLYANDELCYVAATPKLKECVVQVAPPHHLRSGRSTQSTLDHEPGEEGHNGSGETHRNNQRRGGRFDPDRNRSPSLPPLGPVSVIVFKSFFRAGLQFLLNDMIGEVLKDFEIYLHQLTPNAIVRLSVYIWALRS